MAALKIDLHDVFNNSNEIDRMLIESIEEALERKCKILEIIHGKGSGQLKKRVIRFLEQPDIKQKYHRLDKDSKNFGRLFVRFKY